MEYYDPSENPGVIIPNFIMCVSNSNWTVAKHQWAHLEKLMEKNDKLARSVFTNKFNRVPYQDRLQPLLVIILKHRPPAWFLRRVLRFCRDVNVKDDHGGTLFHWASMTNHEVVSTLIEHGLDASAISLKWSPLMIASAKGASADTLQLIIDNGGYVLPEEAMARAHLNKNWEAYAFMRYYIQSAFTQVLHGLTHPGTVLSRFGTHPLFDINLLRIVWCMITGDNKKRFLC